MRILRYILVKIALFLRLAILWLSEKLRANDAAYEVVRVEINDIPTNLIRIQQGCVLQSELNQPRLEDALGRRLKRVIGTVRYGNQWVYGDDEVAWTMELSHSDAMNEDYQPDNGSRFTHTEMRAHCWLEDVHDGTIYDLAMNAHHLAALTYDGTIVPVGTILHGDHPFLYTPFPKKLQKNIFTFFTSMKEDNRRSIAESMLLAADKHIQ